jgi:5-methylcytosine-specific restriction endonuclease McrA
MIRSIFNYVDHTILLLSEHEGIVDEEREVIERFNDTFIDEDYDYFALRRILSRASFLDCLTVVVPVEQDSDAFWEQMAKNQRDKFKRCGLTAKSGFNKETCPCYICNGKCLRRLHGVSVDDMCADDLDKGFLPWNRGHVIPYMVGKENTNTYNYRIICSQCNSASSAMYPADYAVYALRANEKSLATIENITSVLDALKIYFQ